MKNYTKVTMFALLSLLKGFPTNDNKGKSMTINDDQ